jgi:hypothetical protein
MGLIEIIHPRPYFVIGIAAVMYFVTNKLFAAGDDFSYLIGFLAVFICTFLLHYIGRLPSSQERRFECHFLFLVVDFALAFESCLWKSAALVALSYSTLYAHELARDPSWARVKLCAGLLGIAVFCDHRLRWHFQTPENELFLSITIALATDSIRQVGALLCLCWPMVTVGHLLAVVHAGVDAVVLLTFLAMRERAWARVQVCATLAGAARVFYRLRSSGPRLLADWNRLCEANRVSAVEADLERDRECAECKRVIGPGDRAAVLSCGHPMHQGCALWALARARECPRCMAVLTEKPFQFEEIEK